MDSNITLQTKQMIDSLKAVCTNFGLGNASSEYKIITEVFLYKFLNDKFLFEAKRVEPALAKLSPADAEKQLAQMTDDDYELFLLGFDPDTAKLKQTHFISYLFNRKNEENFHMLFDDTLLDIATYNIDIFSVRTGGQSKMRLFSGISQHVIEAEKKDDFCRAIIDKIAECSFDSVFEQMTCCLLLKMESWFCAVTIYRIIDLYTIIMLPMCHILWLQKSSKSVRTTLFLQCQAVAKITLANVPCFNMILRIHMEHF